jgi:predicted 3-demethylubiquinone-9 3-methyltransferase (glyoxalase superfamily)
MNGEVLMAQKIVPNLWFDSNAEEAVEYYHSLFKNSRIGQIMRYGKASAEVSGQPEGSVLTMDFEIEGYRMMALNGGPVFRLNPSISFMVSCESAREVDRLHNALSNKGEVLMPLDKYPFNERYAWINDRFGVSWQLSYSPSAQKITPCLLFVGEQYGKAQEAVHFYTSMFHNGTIDSIVPYEKDEGEKEGTVKHAEFSLDGSKFVAMDSGLAHAFSFTPAISFMVYCEDQNEIDYFWNKLSAVPQAEQCGWLQDTYGVSWQIVPAIMDTMTDPKKLEKVMEALLPMKKLDIETLKRAYEQE